MRSHFARYGIPDIVVSDCGSQFLAKEFQQLANQWCFKHVKSSPYHHQSNGKAENAVKIMKQLFLKAKEDNRDPQLALLEWRNTPTEGFNSSPAQRFFGRRTRSLLPTTEKALKPKIVDGVPEIQIKKLEKQAKYYNRTSKSLKNLKPGEIIRMQPTPGEKVWRKGKVITEVSPRKYQVEVNGKSYYRNRSFSEEHLEIPGQKIMTNHFPMICLLKKKIMMITAHVPLITHNSREEPVQSREEIVQKLFVLFFENLKEQEVAELSGHPLIFKTIHIEIQEPTRYIG